MFAALHASDFRIAPVGIQIDRQARSDLQKPADLGLLIPGKGGKRVA